MGDRRPIETNTTADPAAQRASGHKKGRFGWLRALGPGLITGAADDDPSGIGAYSQAGAQLGLNMLWSMAFTFPLMAAVQMVSARIGRVTGQGLAANMSRVFPKWIVTFLVALLFIANTINIAADLAAMGAAAQLVVGWGQHIFTLLFALGSLLLQVFVPYHRYVRFLKWLTLSLFAYVGIVFIVRVDWAEVIIRTVAPRLSLSGGLMTLVVAVFGTTISPYLLFWQSSQEVEEQNAAAISSLRGNPESAVGEFRRIRWDTLIGMGFSNLIAFFIILATAVTLHAAGQTNIQTSAQAAEALRPVAGDLAFLLFGMGIIGTGLLAIPVLAGSAAYAIAETRGWSAGLERQPRSAVGFYAIIGLATAIGFAVHNSPIDPVKALFWSAVLNGLISAPILCAMMIVAGRRSIMGPLRATTAQSVLGWTTVVVMAAVAIGMFVFK